MTNTTRIIVRLVAVLGVILFAIFYRTDGGPSIATSSYTVEEIVTTMNTTEHIRFIEELGVTPNGRTLFSYQWVDYGLPDAFTCFNEVDEVSEALDMKIVKR